MAKVKSKTSANRPKKSPSSTGKVTHGRHIPSLATEILTTMRPTGFLIYFACCSFIFTLFILSVYPVKVIF
ncbi:hypothetical protein L5515_008453 [Caenorhabditis briggsae]|uniref:Uncharacterized protein n=1 Tax=Caenorhabditis briggsae TaxID=6238 RepID=A0AAE9F1E6_CAEBR|nr:hypothetical protein L3Y34_008614 [Caenorhabditis briggsae]UMM36168.1 hypothetical protein L5515_008453 [Caenorhabditis briggsae]